MESKKMESKKIVDVTRDFSKKVKVIGQQDYINPDTGELLSMNVISIQERDFNFHKIWLGHIFNSLGLIGNQKTRLAFWIIDHLNSSNQLCMTYRQIADQSGISLKTVQVTMQSLLESNFLIRYNIGVYMVNPSVLWKGSHSSRMNVLYQYQDVKRNGLYSLCSSLEEQEKCNFKKDAVEKSSAVE